ncbi:MAG: 50S ribosomal protein L10 [Simkaniaceae bacterium]
MRQEKQLLLDDIRDQIDESDAFVVTSYKSLGANISFDFRVRLRQQGGRFLVMKKRVFLKAIEGIQAKFNEDELPGHVGILLAKDDTVGATKTLFDFKKSHEDLIEILGGLFEGAQCSKDDVLTISKLPNRDEMRSQLLGLFEAPISLSLSAMEALLTSLMHCLENKAKKEEES